MPVSTAQQGQAYSSDCPCYVILRENLYFLTLIVFFYCVDGTEIKDTTTTTEKNVAREASNTNF